MGSKAAQAQRARMHMHGGRNSSRRPKKVVEPLDLPPESRRPAWTNWMDSNHANMPNACRQANGNSNGSRTSANTSVIPDLPANGAEPRVDDPERLESQTDASNAQSVANDSRRPTNKSENVRRHRNDSKNLPGASPKPRQDMSGGAKTAKLTHRARDRNAKAPQTRQQQKELHIRTAECVNRHPGHAKPRNRVWTRC